MSVQTEGQMSVAVDEDVPCIGCGYNLRTLSRDSVCPECGRSVEASWHAKILSETELGALRAGGLAWLHRMRAGVDLALLAWLLSLGAIYNGIGHNYGSPPYDAFGGAVWLTPFISVYVISCWSSWHLMTARRHTTIAFTVRLLLVVSLLAIALMFLNARCLRFYRTAIFARVSYEPEHETLRILQAIGLYASLVWPLMTAATLSRLTQLTWIGRRRVVAVGFALIGVAATALSAFMAYAQLSYGFGGASESSVLAAYLIGPTATMPAVWMAVAIILPAGLSLASMSSREYIIAAVVGLGFVGGTILLLLLLLALRRTLTRAIQLSQSPASSSPPSPSPHPQP